jgi:hypothetical protein
VAFLQGCQAVLLYLLKQMHPLEQLHLEALEAFRNFVRRARLVEVQQPREDNLPT